MNQSEKWLARREMVRKRHWKEIGDAPVGIVGCVGCKFIETKEANTVQVIATTQDIDLDDEVVVAAGADVDYFFRNKGIFIEHSGEIQDRIGTLRHPNPYPSNARVDGWRVGIDFYTTPFPQEILTMVKASGVGLSIGFIPTDVSKPTAEEIERYGRGRKFRSIVRKWKWLELSVVGMPCNVACQTVGTAYDASKSAMILDLVTKGKVNQATASRLGFTPPAQVHRIRIAV